MNVMLSGPIVDFGTANSSGCGSRVRNPSCMLLGTTDVGPRTHRMVTVRTRLHEKR
jgi:hypothetical protein